MLAADAVLLLHFLFVIYVVLGLILIVAGGLLRWSWVRNWWFRISHLAAIVVVVMQSWLGMICPLTTLEMSLRREAGDASYSGAFIAHWIDTILYYQAPAWVFALCYTVFGAVVVLSWFWVRPERGG